VQNSRPANLRQFGFRFGRGGTHARRTMMLKELSTLLMYVNEPASSTTDYRRAIIENNCLDKRSSANRRMTFTYLVQLYSLNPDEVLFRALRFFWDRDEAGRPLIAFLCAYARDAILRNSAGFVLSMPEGEVLSKASFESYTDEPEPGRYSKCTLEAIVSRLSSTWTQSGHLQGRRNKVRIKASATPGSAAYALLLGYLQGLRGIALFESEYAKLLDSSVEQVVARAEEAARSGWIIVNRIGKVVEVLFPRLLTEQETEWVREQA
jgi:hypothetical protein